MTLIDEIEVRIDLNQVDIALIIEGIDAGYVDRMIAAQHHRQRAYPEDGANSRLDVGMALDRISVDDVGVTDVNKLEFALGKIRDVIFVVIGASVPKREQRRGFADAARALTSAGAPLRPEVEWSAEDRNIRIEPAPVGLIGPFPKRADSDERQVSRPLSYP